MTEYSFVHKSNCNSIFFSCKRVHHICLLTFIPHDDAQHLSLMTSIVISPSRSTNIIQFYGVIVIIILLSFTTCSFMYNLRNNVYVFCSIHMHFTSYAEFMCVSSFVDKECDEPCQLSCQALPNPLANPLATRTAPPVTSYSDLIQPQ